MSYTNWLDSIRSAEKTSVISGKARKVFYKFHDGKQMVEEYSMETGVVQRRAWKKSKQLMGEPEWEIELGEPVRQIGATQEDISDTGGLICESNTEPVLTKRITKKNIEWRIRNLPYPIDVYQVSVDLEKRAVMVRTTNKKYFKTIYVPELDRCATLLSQENISTHHQYNTLIITYKKPEILCEMEAAVLLVLKDVKTETDMDDMLQELLKK